ncbi:MAG: cation transporter [Planctomycetaceae bacterium]|nr:cation transporter [Planctomycetaceae bacterium]
MVAGISISSSALIADAVNSLGDSLTSLAVLYGLRVAQLPADDEHPYGHTRAEGIAATNVAVLIVLSAAFVGWESIKNIGSAVPSVTWWAIVLAGGNVALKEWLFRYKLQVGLRTESAAILAHAWDHRSDAVCSLAVLSGLLAIHWGGPAYGFVDPLAAILVSLGVIWSGVHLFRSSASELMDVQANPELIANIRTASESVAGVEMIEKLLVRKSGLEYLADIHIEVDASMTVEQGLRIGHAVKSHLMDTFPQLLDVLVHLEPYPHSHGKSL